MKSVQIERRKQRAREESFEIANPGDAPIYSRFQVGGSSGRTWEVVLRDLSAPGANTCSCPDFVVNQLGTCKHIEAVVMHLSRAEASAYRRAVLTPPPKAYVFLSYGESVSVEARRPIKPHPALSALIDSHFDYRGRFRGDPVTHFEEFRGDLRSLPPDVQDQLEIAPEVEDFLEYERRLRVTSREQRRRMAAIERGEEHFEPLREPLYPYQVKGALLLAFARRAILADEMGLGKTVQALAAAMELRRREGFRRALVVCPASLRRQWAREIERFTGEPAVVLEGPDRQTTYARSEAFFHILSYELSFRDLEDLQRFKPDLVILDEAQRIKNWRTRTARAVKDIPRRAAFVLTGTPIETDLDALYSIGQFLDQRLLGPLWRYNERYFRYDGRGRHVGYRNLDELKARLAPVFLRRTKEQVRDELPELLENSYAVELDEGSREAYDRHRGRALALLELAGAGRIDDEQRRRLDDELEAMRRCCIAAEHPGEAAGPDSGSEPGEDAPPSKLAELAEVLAETVLAAGKKALVFARDRSTTTAAAALLDRLDINHVHFHGGVPEDQRAALVDAFTTDESCRVFVSTELGASGLNLQVADVVINLDQPWSAARRNQRLGRAYRLGRSRPVQVVNLVADETIEESVARLRGADRALIARLTESDSTRGPVPLEWEVKGRTLREALVDWLVAPPRPLPRRRRAPRRPEPPPQRREPAAETPGLFDGLQDDLGEDRSAARKAEPATRLREALGERFLALVERRGRTWALVTDETLTTDRVRELAEDDELELLVPARETLSSSVDGDDEPEADKGSEAERPAPGVELELAEALLDAGFPAEALMRAARGAREALSGSPVSVGDNPVRAPALDRLALAALSEGHIGDALARELIWLEALARHDAPTEDQARDCIRAIAQLSPDRSAVATRTGSADAGGEADEVSDRGQEEPR